MGWAFGTYFGGQPEKMIRGFGDFAVVSIFIYKRNSFGSRGVLLTRTLGIVTRVVVVVGGVVAIVGSLTLSFGVSLVLLSRCCNG